MADSEEIDLANEIMTQWKKTHGDVRSTILTMHLCLEYRINKIIENKFPNPKILDRLRFSDKLRIIDALGIIDQNILHDLEILNDVRNTFTHNLDITSEKFESEFLNKMKKLWFYSKLPLPEPVYPFNVYSHATMMLLTLLHLAKDEPVNFKNQPTGNNSKTT